MNRTGIKMQEEFQSNGGHIEEAGRDDLSVFQTIQPRAS